MRDDDNKKQQHLKFMVENADIEVDAGETANYYFKAYHTPVQYQVDMCKIKKNSKVDFLYSVFAAEPSVNTLMVHKQTVDLTNSNKFTLDLPGVSEQFTYYNVNFFTGLMTNASSSSYITTIQTGSNKPSIPRDQ